MSLRADLINIALRVFEKRRLRRTESTEELRRGFPRTARQPF